jgi:hypothetical protein
VPSGHHVAVAAQTAPAIAEFVSGRASAHKRKTNSRDRICSATPAVNGQNIKTCESSVQKWHELGIVYLRAQLKKTWLRCITAP